MCFRNYQVPLPSEDLNTPLLSQSLLWISSGSKCLTLTCHITIFMKLSLFLFRNPMVEPFKTNGLREVFSQWKLMLSSFLWLISLCRELRKSQISEKILAELICHHGYLVTCSISLCAFSLPGVSGGVSDPVGWGTVILLLCYFLFSWQVRVTLSSKHRASFVVYWLFRAYVFSLASKHCWGRGGRN